MLEIIALLINENIEDAISIFGKSPKKILLNEEQYNSIINEIGIKELHFDGIPIEPSILTAGIVSIL